MNKTAIKNFAVWARVQLIEAVRQRAFEYEVTEDGENRPGLAVAGGRPLTQSEMRQRDRLLDLIARKGFSQVMEEAAYTWFNRFIAVRFMEANGHLPSQIRVFTDESGAFRPEIIKEALRMELDGLDREKVMALLEQRDDEALYKYLFITQCNALSDPLPGMFERIADWTELLFPANLLRADSVLARMVADIPEEDWLDQVQIIGWLYQYYNSELKDETFALLKKNVKVTKERIPAATQLFTPDWIVRYMVENSLGRLWIEGHPDDVLKANWKYYLEEAVQEPEASARLLQLRQEYAKLQPEEIRLIDPCMGSGHILVYAFDVLMQIYLAQGWPQRDAACSIVENNLYGLDIDERAAQLACFAVMMKARQYDRRFLTRGVRPNLYCTKGDEEGPEYGSLLICKDPGPRPEQQDLFGNSEDSWNYRHMLAQQYDVVVTNPPYMGAGNMSAKLADFVKKNYPDSKSDLFACFIDRCGMLTRPGGYQAMITQHAWMFLSSFEALRKKLLQKVTVNMAHLGPRAFEEIAGEVVQTTSFVTQNIHLDEYKGTYIRLTDHAGQQAKEDAFLSADDHLLFTAKQADFSAIPGSPVAYWASDGLRKAFSEGTPLSELGRPKQGMSTADNARFVRTWHEVTRESFSVFGGGKWFPYNNGGGFRKWYGFNTDLVNWENNGADIKAYPKAYVRNEQDYFHKGITWNAITNSDISVRFFPDGYIFSNAGMAIFTDDRYLLYLLAFINSEVSKTILTIISPTLNFNAGDIRNLPIITEHEDEIIHLVGENIALSQDDWDACETSWDFKRHPLF